MLILCFTVILVLKVIPCVPCTRILDLPEMVDWRLHGCEIWLLVSGLGLLWRQLEGPVVRHEVVCLLCLLLRVEGLPVLWGRELV
jgi:hypothetical protein